MSNPVNRDNSYNTQRIALETQKSKTINQARDITREVKIIQDLGRSCAQRYQEGKKTLREKYSSSRPSSSKSMTTFKKATPPPMQRPLVSQPPSRAPSCKTASSVFPSNTCGKEEFDEELFDLLENSSMDSTEITDEELSDLLEDSSLGSIEIKEKVKTASSVFSNNTCEEEEFDEELFDLLENSSMDSTGITDEELEEFCRSSEDGELDSPSLNLEFPNVPTGKIEIRPKNWSWKDFNLEQTQKIRYAYGHLKYLHSFERVRDSKEIPPNQIQIKGLPAPVIVTVIGEVYVVQGENKTLIGSVKT